MNWLTEINTEGARRSKSWHPPLTNKGMGRCKMVAKIIKLKTKSRIVIFLTLILLISIMDNYMLTSQEGTTIPHVTAETSGKPRFLQHLTGGLNGPLAVAADNMGFIYIADSGNNLIQILHPSGELSKVLGGGGEFTYPNALAVDKDGHVYVGELKEGRIQILDRKGNLIKTIDGETTGLPLAPLAIAVDKEKKIYLANHNGEIFVLNREGELVQRFGEPGREPGQFAYPNGIAVNSKQHIIVSDSGNARLQVFNQEGNFMTAVYSTQFGVAMPRGIALGPGDRIYVADVFGHQVVELDENLKLLFSLGGLGYQAGELKFPNGVTVDKSGRILVAERGNTQISVFGR